MEKLMREYVELSRMTKEIEARQKDIKSEIQAAMKLGEVLEQGGYKASWQEVVSHTLDQKALKAAMPEIVAEYTTERKTERFTIS